MSMVEDGPAFARIEHHRGGGVMEQLEVFRDKNPTANPMGLPIRISFPYMDLYLTEEHARILAFKLLSPRTPE